MKSRNNEFDNLTEEQVVKAEAFRESQAKSSRVPCSQCGLHQDMLADRYIVLGIFVCMLCSLPLGLAALWMERKATKALKNHELSLARKFHRSSLALSLLGLLLGCVIIILSIILIGQDYANVKKSLP